MRLECLSSCLLVVLSIVDPIRFHVVLSLHLAAAGDRLVGSVVGGLIAHSNNPFMSSSCTSGVVLFFSQCFSPCLMFCRCRVLSCSGHHSRWWLFSMGAPHVAHSVGAVWS